MARSRNSGAGLAGLFSWRRPAFVAAVFVIGAAASAAKAAPLPALAADGNAVTVSGISSGGYMAVQFQVAHSRRVAGAGVIAAGPYDCAQGSSWRALKHCMSPSSWFSPPSVGETQARLDALASAKSIDSPDHLRDDRVWLFSGDADRTVERVVVDCLAEFYASRLPSGALAYVKLPEAGHAMPSAIDTAANACASSEPPFINRCPDPEGSGSFDAPGRLLQHLAGPGALNAPAASTLPAQSFDQRPHVTGKPLDSSLAEEGYAYVPASCRSGGCRIHVAFHGCRQGAQQVGPRFVEATGYNRWAETNRLIVLYPQAVPRNGFAAGSRTWLYNPKGCWDWWGYTGSDYPTQKGRQIEAVRKMVDRLAEPLKP